MSIPRYPAYKDSGVDWIGKVPENWGIDRMKWALATPKNGIWGNEEQGDENDIACVRVADFDRQQLRALLREPTIRNITARDREGRILRRNDLLIEKSGGGNNQPVGCIVLYADDNPAVCSNFVAKASVNPGMDASYWCYLHAAAYSHRVNTRSIKQTSGIQNLDQSQYLDELACYPPFSEQAVIAAFLNQETAKIDALIAEQQRLIELLQEKRLSVISHAVTKGLNPDAPMKDSGVAWLGEVPEHWEVKKLKYVCDLQTGSKDTENAVEDGLFPFFVRSQTVERIDSCSFDCEAVLTAGDGAGVGKVFHYHQGPFDFHQRVYMMNNFRSIQGRLFFHGLRANFYKVALEGGAKSTVDSLRRPVFTNFPICIAPEEEQELILEHIEEHEEIFAALTEQTQGAVLLLQERRSALISAAVTGQIDVRGLIPMEAAA